MKRFDPDKLPRLRFLEGRYGADELGRFLSITGCVFLLLGIMTRAALPVALALVLIIWCYIRIFSKKFPRRQAENMLYLQKRQVVLDWFALRRERFRQRKEYAFFRCPGCGRTVRVPKGKGKIRITCRHCGYAFERKS